MTAAAPPRVDIDELERAFSSDEADVCHLGFGQATDDDRLVSFDYTVTCCGISPPPLCPAKGPKTLWRGEMYCRNCGRLVCPDCRAASASVNI